MKIEDLQNYSKKESERLSATYLKGYDSDKLTLHAIAKLAEEVGELSEITLKKIGAQRSSKSQAFKIEDLEGEVADVMLVTGMLAQLADVNIEKALADKFEALDERFKKGMY